MMKSKPCKFLTLFLIGTLALGLLSCAGTPRTYLPVEASMIKPGQSQQEVTELLGPPQAIRKAGDSREEWYYYVVHRHFWQHLPFLGGHLGKAEVEGLQIILEDGKVKKAVYYVEKT